MRITVPFDVNRLSGNQRLCWQERGRRTQDAHAAAALGYALAGAPVFTVPVDVELVVRRGNRMDDDNIISGCKAARDQLCRLGLCPGDGMEWFRYTGVEMECGAKWRRNPEVVFVVRERREG